MTAHLKTTEQGGTTRIELTKLWIAWLPILVTIAGIIYNAASSAIAADVYTNGSGIAVKGKTEGAGRAGFFEVDRSLSLIPIRRCRRLLTCNSSLSSFT